jgi:hypothetical protein
LAHRFANGIKESTTGHQMPPIRDLYGVRQGLGRRFAVPSTTVAGDDPYCRMVGKPRLGGRRLSIRQ